MNLIERAYNWAYGASWRKLTDMIIIHHAAASTAMPDDIHRWHLANGWRGIAYNFYVRKDGSVYRGREENACGGHTTNYNSTSIGVCFEGNFDVETMAAAQIKAGQELLAYLRGKYGNLPVYKHSQLNSTACPGKNYPWDTIVNGAATSTMTPKPDGMLYRVRKSWEDIKSQIGAYLELANAKAVADDSPGYKVYDESGKAAYDPSGTPVATLPPLTRLLKRTTPMMQGEDIRTLQGVLNGLGFNCGLVDGMFGDKTLAAVKAFQAAQGLSVDGIVGKDTWGALEKSE